MKDCENTFNCLHSSDSAMGPCNEDTKGNSWSLMEQKENLNFLSPVSHPQTTDNAISIGQQESKNNFLRDKTNHIQLDSSKDKAPVDQVQLITDNTLDKFSDSSDSLTSIDSERISLDKNVPSEDDHHQEKTEDDWMMFPAGKEIQRLLESQEQSMTIDREDFDAGSSLSSGAELVEEITIDFDETTLLTESGDELLKDNNGEEEEITADMIPEGLDEMSLLGFASGTGNVAVADNNEAFAEEGFNFKPIRRKKKSVATAEKPLSKSKRKIMDFENQLNGFKRKLRKFGTEIEISPSKRARLNSTENVRITRSMHHETDKKKSAFQIGRLVWARFSKDWWPGIIVSHKDIGKQPVDDKVYIYWLGEKVKSSISLVRHAQIMSFPTTLHQRLITELDHATPKRRRALRETVELITACSLDPSTMLGKWVKDHVKPDKEYVFYPYPEAIKRNMDKIKNQYFETTVAQEIVKKETQKKGTLPAAEVKPEVIVEPLKSNNLHPGTGTIVWGKIDGYRYWPAMVIDYRDCRRRQNKINHYWLMWYDENFPVSLVHNSYILKFEDFFKQEGEKILTSKEAEHAKGVKLALNDFYSQQGMNYEGMTMDQILDHLVNYESTDVLAKKDYSELITKVLRTLKPLPCKVSELREKQFKALFSAVDLRNHNITLSDKVCIVCMKDCQQNSPQEHPFFQIQTCKNCLDAVMPTLFVTEENGISTHCIVCGKAPRNLRNCNNDKCSRAYCAVCLKYLFFDETSEAVEASKWLCCLCSPEGGEKQILKARADWKHKLQTIFHPSNYNYSSSFPSMIVKKPIRVLSLFDGISVGLVALDNLNIVVDMYQAVEITENARMVSKAYYKDKIQHEVHDVNLITTDFLKKIGPVDFLIGGSPCNDLSIANPKRKGLVDPTGTGNLFFKFWSIKGELLELYKDTRLFWFYENVASMSADDRGMINKYLESEPYCIDSVDYSPQRRQRLYWTNFPLRLDNPNGKQDLQDVLLLDRIAKVTKIQTVTTNAHSLKQGPQQEHPVLYQNKDSPIWLPELERIFGLPEHYTDVGNLSNSSRRQLIGRAWSAQTVTALWQNLCHFFQTK